MTINIRKSGAWSPASTVKRRSSGAWVAVQTIKRRSGGVWVTIWSAFSATVSAPLRTATRTTAGTATTPTVTCTTTGGSGTITYAWERVSGDTGVTATAATGATTAFSGTVNATTPTRDAVFRCKCTDATTAIAYSPDVSVSLVYSSGV